MGLQPECQLPPVVINIRINTIVRKCLRILRNELMSQSGLWRRVARISTSHQEAEILSYDAVVFTAYAGGRIGKGLHHGTRFTGWQAIVRMRGFRRRIRLHSLGQDTLQATALVE